MRAYTIAIGMLLLCCVSAFKCGGGSVASDVAVMTRAANGGVITSTKSIQVTPKGVRVAGERPVSTEALTAIDESFTNFFVVARKDGLTRNLDYSFFDVMTPYSPCRPSPVQKVPSFLLRADAYDGTVFDQYNPKGEGVKDGIGVTFAAELVLSVGTPGSAPERGEMYVCPDMSSLKDAVNNGADHIALANNPDAYPDGGAYFWCSLYHFDQGFGEIDHPLIPHNGRCTNANFRPSAQPFIPDSTVLGQVGTKTVRRALVIRAVR